MDTRVNPVRERLERVREVLARRQAHAIVVPSSDPHLSEYLPDRWAGREWLSGFTGSMGTLVVARERAALFADSRYWEQAAQQIAGSGIELVKIPTGASMHPIDWLVAHTPAGGVVMVDGQVLGLATARQMRDAFEKAGITLRTDQDLLAEVWSGRPGLPSGSVYAHEMPQVCRPRAARLAAVREAMTRQRASHHLVSSVDDIAWITALRGADVEYNPVFIAHLLIEPTRATLFVGAGKIGPELAAALAADGVAIADYGAAGPALAALPAGAVLLLDPKRCTWGMREQVAAGVKVIEAINPSTLAKSRKSDAEAEFIRETMIEDGAAMCAFYARFEAALARGEALSELTVDEWLHAERARRPGFVGLSFSTIAGFNANGALPHYRAMAASHAAIAGDGLLLIDSGGQYVGGTTDITRVWPIGRIDAAQQRDYTAVLKGMMALSRTRFPRGTLAPMLDAIARAPMWAQGLDYGHGTGHGVGYFLNVHEGPQSISRTIPDPTMAMEPGMITSIEPGVYRPGRWGVRIENLVLNRPAALDEATPFGEFLEFETLTLCPIDTRCIERSMLRADEVQWLDAYHATVRDRIAPRVTGDALAWLEARTRPL